MSPQGNSEVLSASEWRPELELHVLEIDQQHRELLGRARVLQVSIEAAKPRQEIQVLLSALIDFTEMHFRTEEELMLANSYKASGDTQKRPLRDTSKPAIGADSGR
jgi:hemerythrin-like metal-binding protein